MKKLSLKNLNLEASDMLQRNQLKSVFGGYGEPVGSCTAKCSDDPECPTNVLCSGSNCTATDYEGCSSDTESKTCECDA
tara:strand:+ start:85181 stop:85417 length:237 start_codon:yes stop_codon:yes gene_type:complete